MDIYDQEGNPVVNFDPKQGWLEQQTRIHSYEAVDAVEEQGHWETIAEYPETGGKDVRWVVDVPGVEGQAAREETEIYWLYIPYTEEELAEMEAARNKPSAEERVQEMEEALELLLSGATEVEENESGIEGQDTGL